MNDLVPVSTTGSTWLPPESAVVQKTIKYGTYAALGLGAALATLFVGPIYIAAIGFFTAMVQTTLSFVLSCAGLFAAIVVAYETFSPRGSIRRMFSMPYHIFIKAVTTTFLKINPLLPFDQRIEEVHASRLKFEESFSTFDGLIAQIQQKADFFRTESEKAGTKSKAAEKAGKIALRDTEAHKWGTFRETAEKMAQMCRQLDPYRAMFQRISQACAVTEENLKTDRTAYAAKWSVSQSMTSARVAANKALGAGSMLVQRSQEAAELIDSNYADSLGQFEHLRRSITPFLESIDLETATYNEALLQEVRATEVKLIPPPAATSRVMPVIDVTPVREGDPMGVLIRS